MAALDRWPFYTGQIKKEMRWGTSGWPFGAGGCYIEVPARPSSTVVVYVYICM